MKVLMQNCVTGRFLGKGDMWYLNANEAMDFGASKNAIAYYISHRSQDAQIVLHFDGDPRLDIQLPLSSTCRDTQHVARQ